MAQEKKYAAESQQFGQAMNSINYSEVMKAAVRDYKKEVISENKAKVEHHARVNVEDLVEDPELQKLHADRVAQLQHQREKRAVMQTRGHGTYAEIDEGDFLEVVTVAELAVVHFFAREFERCKIMDKHLELLARKHFGTRFVKLSAQDAPFFSVKLNVKMLPSVVCFVNGISVESIVGFEPLGGTDDFPTDNLENMLIMAGAVKPIRVAAEDAEEGPDRANKNIRRSSAYAKTGSDEDSDFD